MNAPLAVELAFAKVIRENAELGAGCAVIPWRQKRFDALWKKTQDRTFPMVDLRATQPRADEGVDATAACELQILCKTLSDVDPDHDAIAALADEVQNVCDRLYSGWRGTQADAAIFAAWKTELEAVAGTGFNFGGLTFGEPLQPFDEDGENTVGIVMRVHYSRADFR
jgi:hypothetical protein